MEREGQRAFARLKPLCTQLLDVSSSSPEDRAVVLEALVGVLNETSSAGLQQCADYALFPLLLLLDAAVAGRSSRLPSDGKFFGKGRMMRVGDRVAELVLSCVEIIVQRCVLETIEQVTMLLQKLIAAAMLSAAEASEEFRHGVVKCLQALLHNLRPCGSATCRCKSASSSPFVALKQDPWFIFNEFAFEPTKGEQQIDYLSSCPMGYMQSESMSAVIGHLISLLLQISEAEVGRGAIGSGKVRRDALLTLRTLILKVGTADGLAFFLPGVASGLSKVMNSSRPSKLNFWSSFPSSIVHTSGAAGWPAVVEEAIRGLTEMVVIVLGDKSNAIALEICSSSCPVGIDMLDSQVHVTAGAALETLQGLSAQLQSGVRLPSVSAEATTSESETTNKLELNLAQGNQQNTKIVSQERALNCTGSRLLRSDRTKEWLDDTTFRINALLSQTLHLLCAHQSPSVRMAVTEAAAILLATCGAALKICTTLFLECLLALACDDWENVASAAQTYLTCLMAPPFQPQLLRNSRVSVDEDKKQAKVHLVHSALAKVTLSILEQLPRVVFTADISMAVLQARRLAAAMYFLGPEGVSLHLLGTMAAKQTFIRTLAQCLSFNTTFTGSLEQIISSSGAVVSEIKSVESRDDSHTRDKNTSRCVGVGVEAEELPTMPPWLSLGTGSKLYRVLANVLRLAGLSAVIDQHEGTLLISLVELLLVNVRQAATNAFVYGNDSIPEDGSRKGQIQRMAATSVCVLNEIVYGASGAWNEKLFSEFGDRMFANLQSQPVEAVWSNGGRCSSTAGVNTLQQSHSTNPEGLLSSESLQRRWQAAEKDEVRKILSECAGEILHDYLATEIWEQPTDLASASLANSAGIDDLQSIHVFQDNAMLQKVLVDGVGVLGIALGKAFSEGGFLGLVLFPLLEKLACSNNYVCGAAAISLKTLCSHCQYTSVRDLVVANVDFVVDSLCRQFRHLTMYPSAPNLFAAILHHTNASADLLPLLEEPLRGVVLELNVLARRSHPHLTVPLLRALREITRATRVEVGALMTRGSTASAYCRSLLANESDKETELSGDTESQSKVRFSIQPGKLVLDGQLEELVNNYIERRRCRKAVAAIATSCLIACGPLLASRDPQPCILALDTVEDGIATLSCAQEIGVHEHKEMEDIKQLCKVIGYLPACDDLTSGSIKDENESNKLLPTMHRVWPQLVLCLCHMHISVIIRAVAVIASATIECGGKFFTRRFQKDAVPLIVKLLHEGSSSEQRRKLRSPGLLMPGANTQPQESAPAAVLKVQEAVLKGITVIAGTTRSASALEGSLGWVAASVIVSACQLEALRTVATDAVLAVSKLDPDLVWILVADLVYGSPKSVFKGATPTGFPTFHEILPPCQSQHNALCVQYAAYKVDPTKLNLNAMHNLLEKLEHSAP